MKHIIVIIAFLLSSECLVANTDSYRIMWRADPATSMVIGWNQINGSNAIVYYDTVDHGVNSAAYANSQSVDHTVSAYGMDNKFVRLSGLQANTIYYFIIEDNNSTSQRMYFQTTPNVRTERLSFLAGGDSRNNRLQRQNANLLVSKLKPHAVLFGGDYTQSGTDTQWIEWFQDWQLTIASDGKITPIVATRGNHESSNSEVVDLFDVPNSEVYYRTSFAEDLVSSYTLNTEISIGGSQSSWLQSTLQNDNAVYKIAQYHKPVRSHTSAKAEGTNQYTHWVPLFDQYGMDLVVECDSHTAKSTWPIIADTSPNNDEGFVRDDNNGTVYVGEGCWGAPLRTADDAKSWTRDSGMFNQIKWIFIDLQQIEIRTIRTDNAASVGSVQNNNIFLPPSNLDINNPNNGSVIIIPNEIGGKNSTIANFTECQNLSISGISTELSGLTYNGNTGTLFSVNDSPTEVYELDLDGNMIRTIALNGFIDTEAICYLGNNKFAIVEERLGRIVIVDIPPSSFNTTIQYPGTAGSIDLIGSWIGDGLKGIAFDIHNQRLHIAKEKGNMEIYQIDNLFDELGNTITPISNFNFENLASGYTAYTSEGFTDITALACDFRGHLFVLSNRGESLIELDPMTGQLLSSYNMSTTGLSKLEGVTIFGTSDFFVIGEPSEFVRFSESCTGTAYCSQIVNGDSDVEERDNGIMYVNSSDIELVNDGSRGNQIIGLEFNNLNIPAYAQITTVNIQFTSDNTNSNIDPCLINIKADANPNPVSISTSSNDLTNRITTVNSVLWSPATWTSTLTAGPNQLSPDLTSVLQEVVNASGSSNINSVIFIIDGVGRRTAASANQNASYGAEICIEYTQCIDNDFDGICDSIDNCPITTNPYQDDTDGNGIGDLCETIPISNCARSDSLVLDENKWIGPLVANWYDNPCYWSQETFPDDCDDVIIDLPHSTINIRSGTTAYGYTLEVIKSSILNIELGAGMCIQGI